MAKERALRGAKLSLIAIVCLGTLPPPEGVSKLWEYVSHVECKFEDVPPAWDDIPGYCRSGSPVGRVD